MSTTATFNAVTVQGIVISRDAGDMTVQTQEQAIFGLGGATQLVGGMEPVDLSLIVELSGFASHAALVAYVSTTLAPLMGKLGSLVLAGGWNVTYPLMTLRGLQYVDLDSQVGALPNNANQPLTPWTDHLRMHFRQLGA